MSEDNQSSTGDYYANAVRAPDDSVMRCRKTTNPRQGITTRIQLGCSAGGMRPGRKTTNPRQGITTTHTAHFQACLQLPVGRQPILDRGLLPARLRLCRHPARSVGRQPILDRGLLPLRRLPDLGPATRSEDNQSSTGDYYLGISGPKTESMIRSEDNQSSTGDYYSFHRSSFFRFPFLRRKTTNPRQGITTCPVPLAAPSTA